MEYIVLVNEGVLAGSVFLVAHHNRKGRVLFVLVVQLVPFREVLQRLWITDVVDQDTKM